jgi:hypothetical protein
MNGAARKRFVFLLLCVLVVPLVAVPAIAVLVPRGGDAGPALAQGSLGGTFHPVAGAFEPDATKLADCEGSFVCLEQAFGNVAYERGPKTALTLFERRIAVDDDVAADCHRISHWIGSAALARFAGSVARTFAQGAPTCGAGYYHGILERAFAGVRSQTQLAKLARSLCLGQGLRRRGYFDRQCQHGLGHGLMIQTGYDLPTALSLCAGLATRWDHLTCSNGVFMENSNTSFGVRSRWIDDSDPLYPCDEVASLDRRHCFARVSTRVLQATGSDFQQAASTCSRLAPRWARYCFRGFGRDAVDVRGGPARTLQRCRLAGPRQGDCLFGAARWVMDRAGSDGTRGAIALCSRAPSMFRSECFRGLGGVVGLLNATDATRRRACVALTRRYADACTSAAIAEVDPAAPDQAWG